MSDEEMVVEEDENHHPIDEGQAEFEDEVHEEEQSIESLKDELKKSRWNVFLFLGVAFVMFGFALFPMTIGVDYDKLWGTSEKDIGFVWGPSSPGEDFMDVPFELEVEVISVPSTSSNISLEAYVLKADDCQDTELSESELDAREGKNHDYQYSVIDSPFVGETYTFEFGLDMGQHCVKVQFIDDNGNRMKENADIKVKGKLWPNQILAGVPGLLFLSISIFAFIGAQKRGSKIKEILENQKLSEEELVLEAATAEKIAQGPGGPPQSTTGPTGPPQSTTEPTGPPQSTTGPTGPPQSTTGPTGPPQKTKRSGPPPSSVATKLTESTRSGPPPASNIVAEVEQELTEPQIEEGSNFEPAGNGYFYRKMSDGSYEQIVYVQSEDGTYTPYQQ